MGMNALDVYTKINIKDYLARPEEKYDKEYSKERQARKTLEQLLKLNLITGNLEVRNKVETKWYWIKELAQEP